MKHNRGRKKGWRPYSPCGFCGVKFANAADFQKHDCFSEINEKLAEDEESSLEMAMQKQEESQNQWKHVNLDEVTSPSLYKTRNEFSTWQDARKYVQSFPVSEHKKVRAALYPMLDPKIIPGTPLSELDNLAILIPHEQKRAKVTALINQQTSPANEKSPTTHQKKLSSVPVTSSASTLTTPKIKPINEQEGMTRQQIADIMGLSVKTLSNSLYKERLPKPIAHNGREDIFDTAEAIAFIRSFENAATMGRETVTREQIAAMIGVKSGTLSNQQYVNRLPKSIGEKRGAGLGKLYDAEEAKAFAEEILKERQEKLLTAESKKVKPIEVKKDIYSDKDDENLVTRKQIAEMLGLGFRSMSNDTYKNMLPKPVIVSPGGRTPDLFDRKDAEEFVKAVEAKRQAKTASIKSERKVTSTNRDFLPPEGYITADEAAEMLGVARRSIYQQYFKNKIRVTYTPNGRKFYLKEDVIKYKESRRGRNVKHSRLDEARTWVADNVVLHEDVQETRARGMALGFTFEQLRKAEQEAGFGTKISGSPTAGNRTFTYRGFDDELKEKTILGREAAKILGLAPRYLATLRLQGKVESILVGNEFRYDKAYIEELAQNRILLQELKEEEDEAQMLHRQMKHLRNTMGEILHTDNLKIALTEAKALKHKNRKLPMEYRNREADKVKARAIRAARADGMTLQAIGDIFGVSRERIRQLSKLYI